MKTMNNNNNIINGVEVKDKTKLIDFIKTLDLQGHFKRKIENEEFDQLDRKFIKNIENILYSNSETVTQLFEHHKNRLYSLCPPPILKTLPTLSTVAIMLITSPFIHIFSLIVGVSTFFSVKYILTHFLIKKQYFRKKSYIHELINQFSNEFYSTVDTLTNSNIDIDNYKKQTLANMLIYGTICIEQHTKIKKTIRKVKSNAIPSLLYAGKVFSGILSGVSIIYGWYNPIQSIFKFFNLGIFQHASSHFLSVATGLYFLSIAYFGVKLFNWLIIMPLMTIGLEQSGYNNKLKYLEANTINYIKNDDLLNTHIDELITYSDSSENRIQFIPIFKEIFIKLKNKINTILKSQTIADQHEEEASITSDSVTSDNENTEIPHFPLYKESLEYQQEEGLSKISYCNESIETRYLSPMFSEYKEFVVTEEEASGISDNESIEIKYLSPMFSEYKEHEQKEKKKLFSHILTSNSQSSTTFNQSNHTNHNTMSI